MAKIGFCFYSLGTLKMIMINQIHRKRWKRNITKFTFVEERVIRKKIFKFYIWFFLYIIIFVFYYTSEAEPEAEPHIIWPG